MHVVFRMCACLGTVVNARDMCAYQIHICVHTRKSVCAHITNKVDDFLARYYEYMISAV